jgi:predicted transposase/invertase (TIGR01784 family)
MGEKGSEEQLLGFINAVLGRSGKGKFDSVEILENKSFSAQAIGGKSCEFDIRARLKDKTKVIAEAQIRNQRNMDKRTLYYWGKEYIGSLEEGQDYIELPNVIAINIVNYSFLKTKKFHTIFNLRESVEKDLILTDALEIHFLDMVKWRRAVKKKGKGILSDPLHRWLTWLDQKSPPELIEEVVMMDTVLLNAEEQLAYLSGDKDTKRLYEMRLKHNLDWNSSIGDARREGLEKGMQKGLKEGKLEIARNLLAEGMQLEFIQKITGLSLEEIKKLA